MQITNQAIYNLSKEELKEAVQMCLYSKSIEAKVDFIFSTIDISSVSASIVENKEGV